jgi:hypothetical protein
VVGNVQVVGRGRGGAALSGWAERSASVGATPPSPPDKERLVAARFTQLVPDCADPERSGFCVPAGHAAATPGAPA